MAGFLIAVLGIWALMHVYVFWRLASIPWVAGHVSHVVLAIVGFVLWSSYVLARVLDSRGLQAVSWPLEYLAANWIGVLFLLFCAALVVDVLTLGGWLWTRKVSMFRSLGVAIALFLALVAFVQANRTPVLRRYEVQMPGLPSERDGTVLVAVSDLHLGNLLGRGWLMRLIQQVNEQKPDLVAVVGDVVDGNVGRVEPLGEVLKTLKAPLGVWAVTGNHEFYAGLDRSVQLFEDAGFRVLRDESAEVAPGLVMAGVDDLTARQQFGRADNAIQKALANRPPGATILLSHTPWQAETAGAAGANLMLSGHTHQGQIWPFTYLVGLRYPLLAGRYDLSGISAIVCRGTGTWGPRMRLWHPSEILVVTLRCPTAKARSKELPQA